MGDPLSLAASIAGLTALADVTFKYVYKYVRAAKDTKTDVQSLSEEINDLASVLRVLGALALDLEAEGDKFDPTLRNHHLDHCRTTLNRVEKRARKAADRFSKPKWESISQQLKWPFSVSETKSLLADLSRHKATINAALAADTMRKLQLSLTKTEKLDMQITAIGEVMRKVEINTLIDVNDHKQRILNFFMTTSPQPNLETSIRLRHPMTGLWLTESQNFRYWLETPGSKLWLTGIPGAGKTVLAGSVVQEALTRADASPKTGAAFFFCDYKNSTTWSTVGILGAISSQLARQGNEAFEILHQYYEDLHPPQGLAKTPDPDELRDRISQMCELFEQTIIVVDGLDECGDETDDVVDALMQVAEYSDRVSMALFSRDHFNIRIRLSEDFEVIPIAAHTEDIQIYVGAELEKRIERRQLRLNDTSMKEEIMETLVNRAKGMFRWVVCQLDYLCDCAHDGERRDALNKLPPDLPESYRRLLERVNRCSRSTQNLVKMCLHFIAFAKPSLPILALRQAVSTPAVIGATLDSNNMISEEEISRRCSSLIRKSENGRDFEFAHFSVQEFLEDEAALSPASGSGLRIYLISESTSRLLLAGQCLRFIQLKNFDKAPLIYDEAKILTAERDKKYPFYEYAATKWMTFASDGLDDSGVFDVAKALFDWPKKPQFQNWAIEFLHSVIIRPLAQTKPDVQAVRAVLEAGFSPLHMAAILNLPEICTFLLDQGSPMSLLSDAISPLDLSFMSVWAMPGLWSDVPGWWNAPGEATGLRWTHRNGRQLFSRFTRDLLPSNKRRNLTIDCLIDMSVKPSYRPLVTGSPSIFSIVCVLGAELYDFTPLVKLLSCNVVPEPAEIDCFECSLYRFLRADNGNAESQTLAILHHLKATSAYSHEWGRQLGSIVWQWALKSHLSYTDNASLVDFRISMSEEALKANVCLAISRDDVDALDRYCADDRVDRAASYSEAGDTLLHLAARKKAPKALELLLTLGCDPDLENEDGDLPIHLCRWYDLESLRVFRKFGISLSCQNTRGCTPFHVWAEGCAYNDADPRKCGFPEKFQDLSRVFELDTEGAIQALLTKTASGDTPLMLILKKRPGYGNDLRTSVEYRMFGFPGQEPDTMDDHHTILENRVLCLLELFSKIPEFWQNHDPVLGAAVNFGSEKVVRHLQEAGVGFEAPVPGTQTPLHLLPFTTTLESVQLLSNTYAHSIGQRVDGKLPVEAYITSSLWNCFPPKDEIIEALVPLTLLNNQKADEKTLWEFICTSSGQFLSSLEYPHEHFVTLISSVFGTMLRLGAMHAYEEQKKQSGLIPFLSGILPVAGRSCYWTCARSTDMVRDILHQTKYWTAARQSHAVLRVLKHVAVFCHNLDMTKLLLEHGVDVHSRSDGKSIIELVCHGDCAIQICAGADGKAIIQKILDHSNDESMNRMISLDEERRGLLHSLATSQDATDILWLVEDLVKRGADINILTRCSLEMSALAYHVRESSIQCAELLLELGADPLVGGDSYSITAIEAAIVAHNATFLKRILDHATKNSLSLDWEHLMEFDEIDGQEFRFYEANALHCACLYDSLDCLKFLLDENLVRIETSKSTAGWTPLHICAAKGSLEAAKVLLSKGADIMAETGRGETALHIAVKQNHVAFAQLLTENGATQDIVGKTARILKDQTKMTQLGREEMVNSLTMAARTNNQQVCESLIAMGCPIDVPLYHHGRCSALVVALKYSNLELAEWLLDHGASPLKSRHYIGLHDSSIEIAAATPNLNPLLPKLLTSYCTQGGDMAHGDDFPFHAALWARNIDGLEVLLRSLEECVNTFADMYGVTPGQTLKDILNRRCHGNSWSYGDGEPTPMHLASQSGSKLAVSLLFETGAAIDEVDSSGYTPLMRASSADMAEHLIRLGASTAAICRFGSLRSMIKCYSPQEFSRVYSVLFAKVPGELMLPDARFPMPTTDLQFFEFTTMTTEIAAMHQLGFDLTQEDGAGRSQMHCIICFAKQSDFVLNNDCGLLRTTPFPWHLTWPKLNKIAFLGSKFRDFERIIPRDIFCRIFNLEPSRGWSPLCLAAAWDIFDIMQNCLEMGAQVDFEGCPLGSAIMCASACGSLNAVKLLVRHGASLTYVGRDGFKSCVLIAGSEEVKSWLLCGQFTELLSIKDKGRSRETAEVKPWSGIVRAGVRLYGKREKAPMGSTLDNAKRLSKARKYWEGKIVPIDAEIVELFAEEIS
ncbi:hypothetical protein NM208_g236 [Fusarium decemcellulare]|uniref:Uncharacterized protein n=1 Tax=Fusarium decemcellulare TaxID=57161 RepID=A0ACC1T009_9HYPO|nr:hypothetical protein NM208_g236 [Fusarium decemcellulare]